MAQVRIVTDSAARFENPAIIEDYNIETVPLNIHFGEHTLLDGIDLKGQDVFQRMRHERVMPTASAPSVARFERLFETLNKTTDQICALFHSRHLTNTWDNAQTARMGLLGRCEIAVIDSQTTSAALGILVQEAAEAAKRGASLEEVVRIVHGIIPRLYCVCYVETLDYLRRVDLISEAQAILGTMLGVKPFLTIEGGELITMEKVRTRSQAIDRLIEFVAEFINVEKLVILQNTPGITDQTRALQDRLTIQCPDLHPPVMLYEPLLATMIGPDGMGMVVYEGVEDDI